MKFIFFVILATLPGFSQQSPVGTPITLDELAIEVKGNSREIAFTNKNAGVFTTETGREHKSGWQGWRVYSKKMMEDYRIIVGGIPLSRKDAQRSVVTPYQLKRFYANGIEETVTLLDSVNAIVVEVDHVQSPEIAIYPIFSDAKSEDDFEMGFNRDILTIAHKNHLVRTPLENYPAAVSVSWIKENLWTGGFYEPNDFGKNFSPGYTKTVNPIPKHIAVFTVGDSAYDAITTMKFVARKVDSLMNARKKRMERLLNASYVRTDNKRFDKALNWAKISLDNLIMNQTGKGIFAGLPWFDNYWGRDTYISLPGATLVTGNFAAAREILKTFAASQDTNPNSRTYGRVPNLITTSSTSYNTADGTPWFTIALGEYLHYSGDTSLLKALYPAVKRGIEGTLKFHADERQFLAHGDAETWMDAAGPSGSWSPRGDRANDIQGLWFRQLGVGAEIASMQGDEASASKWKNIASTLAQNYAKYFVDPKTHLAADHLRKDGTAVAELRPNQLFAAELLGDDELRSMFTTVTQSLVYPHGVASLSQDDPNFHPYHHYAQYYVQDAAYHNGIVWHWLAGKWIDLASRFGMQDLAFRVTWSMVDQILDQGAVGTISELSDAVTRPGEKLPRLSGTFSQAWSLAEFVRTFYQDYLGVSAKAGAEGSQLVLCPNPPRELGNITADAFIGGRAVRIGYSASGRGEKISLAGDSSGVSPIDYRLDVIRASKRMEGMRGVIPVPGVAEISIAHNVLTETHGGTSTTATLPGDDTSRTDPAMAAVHLATPAIKEGLRSLKNPPYRMLSNKEIKKPISGSPVFDVADKENDDKGMGSYTYPFTPLIAPGSLDIKHFTVVTDKKNVRFTLRFRELSNPGFHPEYGFQFTYAAIAIDKDGRDNSGESEAGMNAHYKFGKNFRYETIVYVGGGINVVDAKGTMLAAYMPLEGDEADPLGDDQTKTIEFTLPVDVIGTPSASWKYAVLVGAQDDHGGAGIGEFRSVETARSEWTGGGKRKSTDPNVYDTILPR